MYLHNEFTHCARRGWRIGTEVNAFKFESAMMCTNNVVSTNPQIMDVVFVISLTHKHFGYFILAILLGEIKHKNTLGKKVC